MPAIRAAVLLEAGADPALTDVHIREPIGDEVLVRIDAVGICHTDISVAARWRRPPMVFGHEGAGTVAAAGPDAQASEGQRVVRTFDSCGRCDNCGAGRRAYCDRSTELNMRGRTGDLRIDGADITAGFFGQSSLATYALARQANTVPIDDIDPALAAPLGCSVQTGVGTVLNVIAPHSDDALAVFGAGAVGLSAVMGAKVAGCRTIVAVDPLPQRRLLAAELGATATIDPTATDPVDALRDLTDGGPAAAVDTTAIPDVLAAAIAALRARGTLAVVGLGAPTAPLPVGAIMGKGLTVRGVVEGDAEPHAFLPHLVDLHRRGDLPLEKLVTTFDFDDFAAAWSAAKTGQQVKPVLRCGRYGR